MTHALIRWLWLPLMSACSLSACSSAPPPAPEPPPEVEGVFYRAELQPAPEPEGEASPEAPATPIQVAVTLTTQAACLDPLLAALADPEVEAPPLQATLFTSSGELVERMNHPEARWPETRARIISDGHEVALATGATLPDTAPLIRRMRALEALLAPYDQPGPRVRLWRPGRGARDPGSLAVAVQSHQPVIAWSEHHTLAGAPPAGGWEAAVAALKSGSVLALEAAGAGCPLAAAAADLRLALHAAEMEGVTASALLGTALDRFEALRLVRVRPQTVSSACLEVLGAQDSPEARWALVDRVLHNGDVLALPMPGVTQLWPDGWAAARSLWAERRRWRGAPACLVRLRADRLAPAPEAGARWWITGDDFEVISPDHLSGPQGPVSLPSSADLPRLEILAGLPWRVRGLVPEVLERLGLDAPLMMNGRSVAASVIGAPLGPGIASADEIRAAVVGQVQVAEFGLDEYRVLAALVPRYAEALNRVAHSAEGFARGGPWIAAWPEGGGPEPITIERIQALLLAGATLAPGDLVLPPRPEARWSVPLAELGAGRATLRRRLKIILREAFTEQAWARPGAVVHVQDPRLGDLVARVSVAVGLAPPTSGVEPLVDRESGSGSRAESERDQGGR